jgi:hypothetical protein
LRLQQQQSVCLCQGAKRLASSYRRANLKPAFFFAAITEGNVKRGTRIHRT